MMKLSQPSQESRSQWDGLSRPEVCSVLWSYYDCRVFLSPAWMEGKGGGELRVMGSKDGPLPLHPHFLI